MSDTLAPGTFSWVDLATTDPDEARKFYSALFGWTYWDHPAGEAGPYGVAYAGDKAVAAIYPLDPGQWEMGVPPHWTSYLLVPSAEEAVRRIDRAGGTILVEPFEAMTYGRVAVAQDPTGATFAVWEGWIHQGAALFRAPGALGWNELLTGDPDGAMDFYSYAFGWATEPRPTGGREPYTVFKHSDQPVGGLMRLPEWAVEMGVAPNWMVYFAVSDCDATFEVAEGLGAQALTLPTDLPGVGRGAVMADPTGALFAFLQLDPVTV